jgi:hypothetical protein
MFGVARKLEENPVHVHKRKKVNISSSYKLPKQQTTKIWFQRILGVNNMKKGVNFF